MSENYSVKPKIRKLPGELRSVLLAGNSFMYYNNGIVQWLQGMIAASELTKPSVSMVTIAYGGLDWHDMGSYLKPGAINSYTVLNDGTNRLKFRTDDGPVFDAVVMQDNSQGPIHPELSKRFREYAKKHAATIRENGATPLLMLTWAFTGKPEMTQQLADATITVANENDIMVVPVGLAFAKALEKRPDLKLVIADNRHPSIAGTYLEACVLYAVLLNRTPVGIPWYGLGELTLTPEDATFLQQVAWETVSEFFAG